MMKFLYRNMYLFSKITPEIYPSLKAKFEKELSLKTLGPYYTAQNNEELFNIIMESKIAPNHANNALSNLTQLCKADSDEDINLLVNIVKQKAINFTKVRDIASAISQFQQGVSLILLMTNPNPFSLCQMYKFMGDLCVQINELKKGEKHLKDAENILINLKDLDEEDIKFVSSGLACIQTQLCMISYRQKKPNQALQRLKKALNYWEKVENKLLQEYELTCRLKCMLHIFFQQDQEALQTARYYINFLHESKEYTTSKSQKNYLFSKIYYLNIICTFDKKSQNEEKQIFEFLTQYQSQKGQQKLIELMMMVGIKPDRYKI